MHYLVTLSSSIRSCSAALCNKLYCYTAGQNALLWLVQIASRHYWLSSNAVIYCPGWAI